MEDRTVAPKQAPAQKPTPFKQLSRGKKVVVVCKRIVCIITGGFVFPNAL